MIYTSGNIYRYIHLTAPDLSGNGVYFGLPRFLPWGISTFPVLCQLSTFALL